MPFKNVSESNTQRPFNHIPDTCSLREHLDCRTYFYISSPRQILRFRPFWQSRCTLFRRWRLIHFDFSRGLSANGVVLQRKLYLASILLLLRLGNFQHWETALLYSQMTSTRQQRKDLHRQQLMTDAKSALIFLVVYLIRFVIWYQFKVL